MRRFLALLILVIAGLGLALPTFAQDSNEQDKSFFLKFVEDKISSPGREVSINGLHGALSSDVQIDEITISDDEGVWLRILNAQLVWNQAALLTGRLDISKLSADRIEYLRQPVAPKGVNPPSPEAAQFQVPELPVAVTLEDLSVPHVVFGQDVFGLGSEISVKGRLVLEGGSLDTNLDIARLDGPGGTLTLAAKFENGSQNLDLDLTLHEPEDGVVVNLLDIPGKPNIDLNLKGSGPIDQFQANLGFDAAGERVLTGTADLSRAQDGLSISADLKGPIAQLVAQPYQPFFGTETSLTAKALVRDAGGVEISDLTLNGGQLSLKASANTATDGFLSALQLDAKIADPQGERVLLPVAGESTSIAGAELSVDYGNGQDWNGRLDINGLDTGTIAAGNIALDMSGAAVNLNDPASRRVTINADGAITGITADDPQIAEALGERIGIGFAGLYEAGNPFKLAEARLQGKALNLSLSGQVENLTFDGTISLDTPSLAPFSGVAQRPLSGAIAVTAKGTVAPVTGAFDLQLDGTANDLQVGMEQLDQILAGQTTLSGAIGRSPEGITANNFRIASAHSSVTADGRFSSTDADFTFGVELDDLGLLSDQASGPLSITGTAKGSDGPIDIKLQATVPSGKLEGRTLREGDVTFDGTLQNGALSGKLDGQARLDGHLVELNAALSSADGAYTLGDLSFTAGGTKLTGDVTRTAEGLYDGQLALNSNDLSMAAALLLTEASGNVDANVSLSADNGKQSASVKAQVRDLSVPQASIGSADISLQAADLFGVPAVSGSINGKTISAAGIDIAQLTATADTSGDTTSFDAKAALENGTDIDLAGSLTPIASGYTLALDKATLQQNDISARLVQPTSIEVVGTSLTLKDLVLDVGGGRISASGTAGPKLDLSLEVTKLPLSIANTVKPDLALGGTVDGAVQVTGSSDAPQAQFTISGSGVTASMLADYGIAPLTFSANGRYDQGVLQLAKAEVTNADGLSASAKGSIGLMGDGPDAQALALDVSLNELPLSVANAVAPDLGLGGTLTGTARITGSLSDPAASFDISSPSISAAMLRSYGISSVSVSAAGNYQNETLRLQSASVSSPEGLQLTASGSMPLSGSGGDLNVTGSLPLSIANATVGARGTQLAGTVNIDARITGSLNNPSFGGSVSIAGGEIVDPLSNLRLQSVSANASLNGDSLVIQNFSGNLATGGSVNVSGSVSLNAAAEFPADIQITLNSARYADGNLFVATVSGSLTVTGPLLRNPLLAGNLQVEKAEITVPNLGSDAQQLVEVSHIALPADVARTLRRALADMQANNGGAPPSVLQLDVAVNAPNQVFVRGRGLDVELGGSVRLTGTVNNIQPVGGFELIRGRLSILGQRIVFTSGTVTLIGDLNPYIDLRAQLQADSVTVTIALTGPVSNLDINLSSDPQLPQDEILSLVIFKRALGDLSPLQLARLAAAAAELAGGSNNSLVDSLRQATGLADLDIVTDSQGNTAVKAGSYIQDNVYLSVQAGANGRSKVSIDLDVNKDVKLRGSTSNDGESSVGVFYEKDF